jgi:DNA-binding transcriptional ArsR family regulator
VKGERERSSLDREVYERQARICKAFANPIRLKLLDMLAKRDWQVADIQHELGISKANLSQHLAILKSAGIVVSHRQGRQLSCSLAIPEIKDACQLIRNVLKIQVREQRKLPV